MTTTGVSRTFDVTVADLSAVAADLLVVPVFEEEEPVGALGSLDAATGGQVRCAFASGEFRGRLYEVFATPLVDRAWAAGRVVLLGAGRRESLSADVLRRLASAAGLVARQRRAARMAVVGRGMRGVAGSLGGDLDPIGASQAMAEGLTLAEFEVGSYKTQDADPSAVVEAQIAVPGMARAAVDGLAAAVARGRLLGDCSNLSRGLANEPGNTLPPREFAARAERIAGETGVDVEILDEQRIAQLGMNLLLGVGRGSHEPPRLMVFRYEPAGLPPGPTLGLVGKGVTFDTGGISIKAAEGMERMKDDMAGGAAVVCAMRAIAALKPPLRVVGIVPSAENMPGGMAIRPGDILKGACGKTVEVINTDAEGRLLLGDGLWYAQQLGATHLVDVATLTGSVVVALGKLTCGLFGTPPAWVEQVRRVAERAGDRPWPMPLVEEYRDQLKSEIADFTNSGGRPGGAITAALFLKEFTGGRPWVHLDIAGTAWADEARPYVPKGPTGAAVRTLAELAFTSGDWPA